MAKIRHPANMKMTLKTARELAGYKQDEAARLMGVTANTLRNYEQGKCCPNVRTLRKIEEIYAVKYDQLIFSPFDFG